MADIVGIIHTCDLCTKQATCEVFNRWGHSKGKYCTKHGEAVHKTLETKENSDR
jgi:hypothetical protein